MNASCIVASPYTLTGSIGVIAAWFFDKGLYGKLGLGVDLISRGAHADLPAGILIPRRDLSGEEEERFHRLILDLYDDFVRRVAEGRNLSVQAVEAAAQGRVYSGLRARDLGLVDRIGGLDEALRTARDLAKIPQGRRVRYSEHPKPRLIDRIAARFGLPAPPITTLLAAPTAGIPEDLWYRISRNGEAMPILPLGLLPGGTRKG
jgi:protease-4